MLEGQCDVWNGVISAAVYIALLNGKVGGPRPAGRTHACAASARSSRRRAHAARSSSPPSASQCRSLSYAVPNTPRHNRLLVRAVVVTALQVVTVELNSNQNPRLADIAEVEAKFKKFHQLAEAKGEGRRRLCWRVSGHQLYGRARLAWRRLPSGEGTSTTLQPASHAPSRAGRCAQQQE